MIQANNPKSYEKYRIKLTSSPDFQLLLDNGCINCHSTDGSKITGPSFLDLAKGFTNIQEKKGKISKVKIDAAYIRESIEKPNVKIVQGYRKFSMPEIADDISKSDLEKIIKLLTPDDK